MSSELLGKVERDLSSSRTSPVCSVLTVGTLWPELLRRWPRTGSLRNGFVFGRQMSVPLTTDFGGSALPTPTTDDANNLTRASGDFQSLARTAHNLLPTPTAFDMGKGRTVEEWDEWTEKLKTTTSAGNGHGRSLEIEAMKLLPTPTCQDGANNGGPSQFRRHALPLNTLVTTFPDSDPTPMPSPDGNLLSDDQPLAPPTTSGDSVHDSWNG